MTQGDLLSWSEAQAKGESGANRAVEHADRVEPAWSEEAMRLLLLWARSACNAGFLIEEARVWAHLQGLPRAPDSRAWGAVVRSAARRGLLVRVGWEKARSSNCGLKALWKLA